MPGGFGAKQAVFTTCQDTIPPWYAVDHMHEASAFEPGSPRPKRPGSEYMLWYMIAHLAPSNFEVAGLLAVPPSFRADSTRTGREIELDTHFSISSSAAQSQNLADGGTI